MKTESYLSTTDDAGDGTIVTCACVDLGSSTRPEARRFIHDFQSRFGSPPGVFARRRMGRGRDAARGVPRGRPGSPDGRGRPVDARRIRGPGEHVSVRRRRGARARVGARPRVPGRGRAMGPGGSGGRGGAAAGGHARFPVGRRVPEGPAVRLHEREAASQGSTSSSPPRSLAGSGSSLSWRDLPCRTASRAVSYGTLDAVLTPSADVGAGHPHVGDRAQPASRARRRRGVSPATNGRCCSVWGRATSWSWCARGRASPGRTAICEPRARRCGSPRTGGRPTRSSWPARSRPWPTSSRRRGVRSNGGVRSGSPRASTREPTTSSWPRGPMLVSWRRSTRRSPG